MEWSIVVLILGLHMQNILHGRALDKIEKRLKAMQK